MVFHDPKIDGNMRMKILTTFLTEVKTFEEMIKLHEQKVNDFNDKNVVFFNTLTDIKEIGTNKCHIISVVLYANGRLSNKTTIQIQKIQM